MDVAEDEVLPSIEALFQDSEARVVLAMKVCCTLFCAAFLLPNHCLLTGVCP